MAPEQEGALEVIEHVAKQGVTVSIGHTNANGEQIDAAIKAGATMSTHLGNGAHHVLPRFPNYIQEQMAADAAEMHRVLYLGDAGQDNILEVVE